MREFGLCGVFAIGMGLAAMASAEENAFPPEKTAPAVTVSSLPQDIQLIVGMSGEDYYQPRMDAIHALGEDLPPDQIRALMDFLFTKIETQRLPDLEFNGLKNELTWVLIRQRQKPVDLAANLVKMYQDKSYDETWRDYCVQFCAKDEINYLGNILREMWKAKLRLDFPDKNFEVEFCNADQDDLVSAYITFWQV